MAMKEDTVMATQQLTKLHKVWNILVCCSPAAEITLEVANVNLLHRVLAEYMQYGHII